MGIIERHPRDGKLGVLLNFKVKALDCIERSEIIEIDRWLGIDLIILTQKSKEEGNVLSLKRTPLQRQQGFLLPHKNPKTYRGNKQEGQNCFFGVSFLSVFTFSKRNKPPFSGTVAAGSFANVILEFIIIINY
jgi:hypothetical protein